MSTSAAPSIAFQRSSSASAPARVPVWIWGAKGLLAGELLRLLELHPALSLAGAVSRSSRRLLASAHPHCPGDASTCSAEEAEGVIAQRLAAGERCAALLALPHGESCEVVRALRARLGAAFDELRLVDLSADFRLRDPILYADAYGRAHPLPAELEGFVYGLPELDRERILAARRVAAPGCFATALQLAAWPAARARLLDASRPWTFFGVTGSSGSGAEPRPGTHHPHRHGNLWAYSLEGHRHEAELAQRLGTLSIHPPIHFVPHSGPFARGIHLTAALPLAAGVGSAEARAVYREAFAGEPFVEVLAEGAPDLRSVSGSNRASLGVFARGATLTVLATLDNIVKGGAGQALQCLNLLLGFPETWGLPRTGLGVC